jgi:anti-sigma B factor antagonist
MTIQNRTVTVKQLPQTLSLKQEREFLRQIQISIGRERPCIVLDCSNVRQLDRSTLHLLLCCLEEAMKRNGDLKLAALPVGAAAILEQTGVTRLFEIYDTTADAVNSFRQLPARAASQSSLPAHSDHEPIVSA